MTKKEKRKQDNRQRGSWYGVNPLTKIVPDKKKEKKKKDIRKKIRPTDY